MSGLPNPISSEIIEEINSINRSGAAINEISLMKIKRKIDKIPSYADRYECLGMYYSTKRDVDNTIKYFEKAIKLSSDSDVFINFMLSLKNMELLDLAHEQAMILLERDLGYCALIDLHEIFSASIDIDSASKVLSIINKKYPENSADTNTRLQESIDYLDYILNVSSTSDVDLSMFSFAFRKVYQCLLNKFSQLEVSWMPEPMDYDGGKWASINFNLKGSTAQDIEKANNLVEEIFIQNYDKIDFSKISVAVN